MGEIFKGWRRRLGLMTLMLSLVLMGCWARSQYRVETMQICGSQSLYSFGSIDGGLCLLVARTRPAGIPVFNWNSLGIKEFNAFRLITNGKLRLFSPSENLDVDWQSELAGFRFGVGTTKNHPWNQAEFYVVPYFSVILPLALLSAYLLHIKQQPRNTRHANVSDSCRIDSASLGVRHQEP